MEATATATGHVDPIEIVDVMEIMAMIPHRYPMLMIDRVVDMDLFHSAIGIKGVTINEPFFVGHFPQRPVMPGVLLIECMAQTAAVLVVASLGEEARGKLVYFMSVDDARFRRPVTPGDNLRVPVSKIHHRKNVWKFSGQAIVDDRVCAEAKFTAMLVDS